MKFTYFFKINIYIYPCFILKDIKKKIINNDKTIFDYY